MRLIVAEVPSVHPPGAITNEALTKAIWVPHVRYRQKHVQDISLTLHFFSKAIDLDANWSSHFRSFLFATVPFLETVVRWMRPWPEHQRLIV